ncbi:MAG: hypothetical protein AAGB26_05825 [Planctomycetota bacterium]
MDKPTTEQPPEQPRAFEPTRQSLLRRSWTRWIVPVLALAVTVGCGLLLYNNLRSDTWSYFTDEEGLRVEIDEDRHRFVLWDDPKPSTFNKGDPDAPEIPGFDRLGQGRVQATFSPDGTAMVLSHHCTYEDDRQPHTDLYLSKWDGRTWSRPEALSQINTPHNEHSAAFSADGQQLFFSSDRPAGQGGDDLYVAKRTDNGWSNIQPLGKAINSPANEIGPAPTADGSGLFFHSDRQGGQQDIYFAKRQEPQPDQVEPALFAEANPFNPLNSPGDDLEANISERGGYVFIASDRGSTQGLRLFLSRVVDGEVAAPQAIDLYIDEGNVADPAARMDGFDLVFSTDANMAGGQAESGEERAFGLFQSTTREVIGYFDLSRWEAFKTLLSGIMWWVLLAIAALIGMIYLLEKWRDITSLYHKCLAGSVMIHLLVLFLMMSWLISQQLDVGGEPQSPEVALSIDALAQEELAMESEQELAQVAETTRMTVSKAVTEFREVQFEATDVAVDPLAIVRQSAPESLISEPTPSAASESNTFEPLPLQDQALPAAAELTPTLLPGLEVPQLEVKAEVDTPPVDLTEDNFEVDPQSLQKVQTAQLELETIESPSIDVRSDAESVDRSAQAAKTTDTGGQTVNPSAGFESNQALPDLIGQDAQAGLSANLPGLDPLDALTKGPKLETPDHELDPEALTKLIRKQTGKPSLEVIEELGGSEGTERAIAMGLDWLTKHQEPDGHWDMAKHGSSKDYNTAGAGLALLCYYGWGIKHGQFGDTGKHPEHTEAVTKALNWLIVQQKEDGDLRGAKSGHAMYCHGIASIALCEAYALTEDPAIREAATLAIRFIINAQHHAGGWRYNPGQTGDLSVTSWQLMALHSASMAGIEVPEEAFEKARGFLDAVAFGKHGGRYGYTGPSGGGPAMTPTGMFLRQLDLEPPDQPRMIESARYMQANMLKPGKRRFYYEYYGTLALYQHQGPIWQEWNENMKQAYIGSQVSAGEQAGSWDPNLDANFAKRGGRLTTTTLAILSLEVYYRLLPLYGYDRDEPAE